MSSEYNQHYPALAAGTLRHDDHRFEFGRAQFEAWAREAAAQHGYTVQFRGIGDTSPTAGTPTQMAIFQKGRTAA